MLIRTSLILTPAQELASGIQRAAALGRGVKVQAGLSDDEIGTVETRVGAIFPLAIRDLLRMAGSVEVPDVGTAHFSGCGTFRLDVFPNALPIMETATGQTWIIDLTESGWNPVILVSRRPGAIVIQASSVSIFVAQLFEPGGPHRLIQPYVEEIVKRNPHTILSGDHLQSTDPVLRDFARKIGSGYLISDLRNQRAGIGFRWHEKKSTLRAGTDSVFAVPTRSALLRWIGRQMGLRRFTG